MDLRVNVRLLSCVLILMVLKAKDTEPKESELVKSRTRIFKTGSNSFNSLDDTGSNMQLWLWKQLPDWEGPQGKSFQN